MPDNRRPSPASNLNLARTLRVASILWPARIRRQIETGIVISLAGPVAEELPREPVSIYPPERSETPDELAARAAARELADLSPSEASELERSAPCVASCS
jgi:hypothetical protein